jgi:pSer/pThr/pTyr-binding forkhead associated (FHA) protein
MGTAMAFIIVADSKSDEIERRELAGPMVIGRSPECDLPVRDILLSRRHCLIERIGDAWVIADLGSKNGTVVNGDPITRHVLHDMDVVRLGRTRIAFREGPFIPAPPDVKRARVRPADPLDAMAGTLSGFRFSDAEEEEIDRRILETFPRPKPHPVEPRSYQSEKVQALITDIASSAWDSVLVEVDRSAKTTSLPRPMVAPVYVALPAPVPPIQPPKKRRFSLQSVITMLYIALTLFVSGLSVWVISWSW